ncbi:MAG: hypothetical protein Q7T51_03090 [Candidatus Moranbacteria bacterium]|nr:hypothetical protein [Candidatus Moranbacteria bacterium]
MAHVTRQLIRGIKLGDKLSINQHNQEGGSPYALPDMLRKAYLDAGYGDLPTNRDEAVDRGAKTWNGAQVAINKLAVVDGVIHGNLVTLPWMYSQAMNDLYNMRMPNTLLARISPNFLHVSLLAQVMYKGALCLVGQVRGDVIGKGELQTALCAGSMNKACAIAGDDMIIQGLEDNLMREIGLNLGCLNIKPGKILFHEPEVGRVNLASVSEVYDFEHVRMVFQAHHDSMVTSGSKPECARLALIPVATDPFNVVCDNGDSRRYVAKAIEFYDPITKDFGVADFLCRYLTQAVIDHLIEADL